MNVACGDLFYLSTSVSAPVPSAFLPLSLWVQPFIPIWRAKEKLGSFIFSGLWSRVELQTNPRKASVPCWMNLPALVHSL